MRNDGHLSLTSRGSRVQFVVAVALTSLIPLLVSCFLMSPLRSELGLGRGAVYVLLVCGAGLVALGFALLLKYPINIMRLRRSLESLADGRVPDTETVTLIKNEDDLSAIEDYMINIIRQTEERISTIEQQSKDLVQAETQRAMIESLGAACHHLGQPATVISTYLDMISKQTLPAEAKGMIDECKQSVEKMGDILDTLRSVAAFRSEAYRPVEDGQLHRSDERILDIH